VNILTVRLGFPIVARRHLLSRGRGSETKRFSFWHVPAVRPKTTPRRVFRKAGPQARLGESGYCALSKAVADGHFPLAASCRLLRWTRTKAVAKSSKSFLEPRWTGPQTISRNIMLARRQKPRPLLAEGDSVRCSGTKDCKNSRTQSRHVYDVAFEPVKHNQRLSV
jgi:hypothetical protein